MKGIILPLETNGWNRVLYISHSTLPAPLALSLVIFCVRSCVLNILISNTLHFAGVFKSLLLFEVRTDAKNGCMHQNVSGPLLLTCFCVVARLDVVRLRISGHGCSLPVLSARAASGSSRLYPGM